ncbi:MAG: ATP-dependent RNA helicase HrpA [Gammaproteobacteria bacterium]|nr:ATP-dependent RNA helicase HrpA [Gammaproteobacteria bacterium]
MRDKNTIQQLFSRLGQCMLAEQFVLRKRLNGLQRRVKEGQPIEQALAKITEAVDASVALKSSRLRHLPKPSYPENLPVSERREEIKEVIAAHQVVIVAGETGSGKTTQLPKICLELGRGVNGYIGHTQPRRLAARSLAARIAEELNSEVGKAVGFKVRFSDQTQPESYIKIMTDGILLAEMRQDRSLNQYDTLIIDEAHERSLNIDFLLGYLKQLLPKRPDLKVIITSATIDTARFSKHFDDAPVVEVSGRTYPVEQRYRPLYESEEKGVDRVQGILDAVDEISRLDRRGDMLIFLPGEREIRETAEALRKHHPHESEILPLFSRLSAAEQGRIFQPSRKQRIVLATNVAETSLTVPGIRYVIDPGVARISRYSYRSKVQRLPIEAISQASANQRAGRCGRVAAGVCIRLYSEDDFNGRPEFTVPEIHRTNLASVILQMKGLGLGDIEAFPFVDAPDSRMVNDGYKLLQELGAIDRQQKLLEVGRKLARLPVDPRIGRMVLAAIEEGALAEVLVIASALSVQEPRDRPADKQQAADEKHNEFKDEASDFLLYLNLWNWFQQQKAQLSRNQLRRLCKKQFISYLRMLEWEDIHKQLASQLKEMGHRSGQQPADYAKIHRSLMSGLLGNLAFKQDDKTYLGTRSKKLMIFPGSALRKKQPKWLMAAELVETSQLFARTVAKIEPEWIEAIAEGLCKKSYSDAHWEKRRAQVVAFEKVTLYGLSIVAWRKVHYGPLEPELSREIFIRGALVSGEYRTQAACLKHNRCLIDEIEQLESKSRRRDLLVDEELIFAFYDRQLPKDIFNGIHFERWYKKAQLDSPSLLFLSKEDLLQRESTLSQQAFPDQLNYQGIQLDLEYHFDPNHQADGINLKVPLALLNQLEAEYFEWLVPGMLPEKVTRLIKALPKPIRRNFVPAPDYAQACVDALPATPSGSLLTAVARQLNRIAGEPLPVGVWDQLALPDHLLMNFKVIDSKGKLLAQGRDLSHLKSECGSLASEHFAAPQRNALERSNITQWDFESLPEVVEHKQQGVALRAYPALVDEGASVALKVLDTATKAEQSHHAGLRRLFVLQLSDKIKYLHKNIPHLQKMTLCYSSLGNGEQLKQQIVLAAVERSFMSNGVSIYDKQTFEEQLQRGRGTFITHVNEVADLLQSVLQQYHQIRVAIKGNIPPFWLNAMADIQQQLQELIYKGFIIETPYQCLVNYPRYLKGILLRIDKLNHNLDRDKTAMLTVARVRKEYQQCFDRIIKRGDAEQVEALLKIRWLIEELRISLFSQEIKTLQPISERRLEKMMGRLLG